MPESQSHPGPPTDAELGAHMIGLLNEPGGPWGGRGSDIADYFNSTYNLPSGKQAVYYDASSHGRETIGLPGGYLSHEADGWKWTTRSPETGGKSAPAGGAVGGTLFPPFAAYVPPTPSDLPSAPGFRAPPPFTYDKFQAPSLEQAQQAPGYEFARGEGLKAVEQSAAGKGLLRSGGTLKDLNAWGDKFATQNYQNVFNNAASVYNTNFNTAKNMYQSLYQTALDEFAPQEQAFLTGTNSALTQNQNNASNAWASWYGQNSLDLQRRNNILNGQLAVTS